jgi:hypothetical protein
MRIAVLLFCAAASMFAAPQSDEKDVVAVVQRLFDALAAHDGDAITSLMIPGGRLVAVRDSGATASTPEDFAARLKTIDKPMLERMWNPKTLVHGRIAVVWAEYDFHLDGKFMHCGIDSVNLVKTAGTWKIAAIVYTAETTGCAPSPLGPPKE